MDQWNITDKKLETEEQIKERIKSINRQKTKTYYVNGREKITKLNKRKEILFNRLRGLANG